MKKKINVKNQPDMADKKIEIEIQLLSLFLLF